MFTASRPSALDRLDVFIGRWLTEGETVATAEAPSVRILASDVYEWGPGGRFIMHPAYGRIGRRATPNNCRHNETQKDHGSATTSRFDQ
jgi:hypothetical protein